MKSKQINIEIWLIKKKKYVILESNSFHLTEWNRFTLIKVKRKLTQPL